MFVQYLLFSGEKCSFDTVYVGAHKTNKIKAFFIYFSIKYLAIKYKFQSKRAYELNRDYISSFIS